MEGKSIGIAEIMSYYPENVVGMSEPLVFFRPVPGRRGCGGNWRKSRQASAREAWIYQTFAEHFAVLYFSSRCEGMLLF